MSAIFPPINFKAWIEENRHLLKPPVGNKVVWKDGEFIVMVVGGPNSRTDYHYNETPEFFYQLEGDITLKIMDNGQPRDIPIKEGEIFVLPGPAMINPRVTNPNTPETANVCSQTKNVKKASATIMVISINISLNTPLIHLSPR